MQDATCRYDSSKIRGTATSIKKITSGSESAVASAINSYGPLSVAIDASLSSFQFYSSGVYYDSACNRTAVNHGVTLVGYGTNETSGFDYYIVKNSWGTWWGDQGYVLMARNKNNSCGIASYASFPVI